jgi:hypothetical protein
VTLNLTQPLSSVHFVSIERAVLETLAYSDIFDYPLRIEELHHFLPLSVDLSDLQSILNRRNDRIGKCEGYYFLAGREELVSLRKRREINSLPAFRRAVQIGRILGLLPFIRMVGLTGSLAHLNCDSNADIDYLIVASHGRVWMARAFALIFGRLTSVFSSTLCPNLIISEQVLEWQQQDIYSARELCQLIPITGMDVYLLLRHVNTWTNNFLPNASNAPDLSPKGSSNRSLTQKLGEYLLGGLFGDGLEVWEMDRKIKRFMNQPGYGVETRFNKDICQGNFNHHGLQTKEAYQQRLAKLDL